jgi:predicted small secreted protein
MIRSEKMNMAKKNALLCMLIVCCITLFGCNTMHGAGKDIEQGGKAIQKAAE